MATNNSSIIEKFKNIDPIVAVLSIAFGIGSWLGVNSTFIQIPLIIKVAPEEWRLPSYMEVINQCGNIGPIIYTLIQKYSMKKIRDDYLIYFNLSLGVIATFLMIFFYGSSIEINGEKHSLPLFIIFYCLAIIGCTSSVLFMPYMGRFKEIYLITYFIGEGLSGFISSCIGLIQGVGGNEECLPNNSTDGQPYVPYSPPPRFGTKEFFIFVVCMMTISLISFILLNNIRRCKKQYTKVQINYGNNYSYAHRKDDDCSLTGEIDEQERSLLLPIKTYGYLLFLLFLISYFENGVLASIQSYSTLPYGYTAYHLTVSFTLIVNPISSLSAIFLPKLKIRQISIIVIINMILGFYILSTAIMSPNPPLIGTKIGIASIIIAWTVFFAIFKFVNVNISTIMRSQGGRSLVWAGACSQLGSSVGAVIMFCLVNFAKVFTKKEPCT